MGIAPLTLDPTTTEVLRIYEVTLEKPDLTDDDGQPVEYPVTVALRYTMTQANQLDPKSYLAREEAARRACKLERREFHTTGALYAMPENVRLVSSRSVPGRVKR